jgi:cytochrome c
MSNLKGNMIFGAVLATGLGVMGVRLLTDNLYHVEQPATPGYAVEVAEEAAGPAGAAAVAVIPDWGTVLPTSDIAAGEAVFKKCASCHDVTKGGANKTGPHLWGILGNKPGTHAAGFNYSEGMKAFGAANTWDYDTLYKFLENPKGVVKGTAMSFAGLKKSEDRVAIIAYLRAQSDSPAAIPAPKPAEAAPAPEAAPAAAAPAEAAPAAH